MRLKTKGNEGGSGTTGILKIKEAIFGSADPVEIEKFEFIPTNIPALDKKLGGGVIIGGVVELIGLEASGKSTLAALVAAQAQKKDMPVVYLDTEAATSMARLKSLGVDIEKLVYVQPSCLQEVYDTIGNILKTKLIEKAWSGPALIVWDSLAQTPAKQEVEMEEGGGYDKEMAVRARVNSMGLRKLTIPLQNAGVTLLIINQLRENVGQTFGEKYSSPGGHAPKYAAIQRILLTVTNTVKIDEAAGIKGKLIRAKTIKNKAYTPLLEIPLVFNNGIGSFDELLTMWEVLKEEKRLTSSGKKWDLNLNSDLTDTSNIVSFQRGGWEDAYLQNRERIIELLS